MRSLTWSSNSRMMASIFCAHEKKNLDRIKMAISLDDAWDISPAQVATPAAAAVKTITTITPKTEVEASSSAVGDEHALLQDELRMLVAEFRQLRHEESRRCTVYLMVAGILFALLFVYIDRLQNQIKDLHTRTFVGNPEPRYTSTRLFPQW